MIGLCACGCEQPAPIATRNSTRDHKVKGKPMRFISGHNESRGSLLERFWAKVNKNGPVPEHRPELGPCWIWTAAKFRGGYGRVKLNYKFTSAHRISWKLMHGEIPSGMSVLHACDVPLCVRHLFVGTQMDNMRDCRQKERHPGAKIFKCPKGHPYAGSNIRMHGNARTCRTCGNTASLRWYNENRRKHGHQTV